MVRYRKNKNWGTVSGSYNSNKSRDTQIQSLINNIPEIEDENTDIDIIDISIREVHIPDTSVNYSKNIVYITIMYAIVSKEIEKKKVQI